MLFLSSITGKSRALREEIDYGINILGLPVIAIYPEYDSMESLLTNGDLKRSVKNLWDKLPVFRDLMEVVPTIHMPMKKELIKSALQNDGFMVRSKKEAGIYWFNL